MLSKINYGLLIMLLFSVAAFAQNQTPSAEYNKFEVFAGYSENSLLDLNRIENFDSSNGIKAYHGWNTSVTYNFKRYVAIKADISEYYKHFSFIATNPAVRFNEKASIYNYLGGLQIEDNKKSKRFSPFVHALGGFSISKTTLQPPSCLLLPMCKYSAKGFALALGGGIDLKVKKQFSIRLLQIDYNPAFYKDFREHKLRASFGIVFH